VASVGMLSAVSTSGRWVTTCASTPNAPPTAAPPSMSPGTAPAVAAADIAPTPAPTCIGHAAMLQTRLVWLNGQPSMTGACVATPASIHSGETHATQAGRQAGCQHVCRSAFQPSCGATSVSSFQLLGSRQGCEMLQYLGKAVRALLPLIPVDAVRAILYAFLHCQDRKDLNPTSPLQCGHMWVGKTHTGQYQRSGDMKRHLVNRLERNHCRRRNACRHRISASCLKQPILGALQGFQHTDDEEQMPCGIDLMPQQA